MVATVVACEIVKPCCFGIMLGEIKKQLRGQRDTVEGAVCEL